MLDRLAVLFRRGRLRRFDVAGPPADVLLQSAVVLRGVGAAVTRPRGRARIALERVAVNVMDFEIADNAGYRALDEPCVAGGPAAYFSTLPLGVILDALVADGVPAYVSNTAGTYLCNQTMYTTRHLLERRGVAIPAGFIHLPQSAAMVAASGLDQPSMDLPLMIRAIESALRVTAASLVSAAPSARRA